MRIIVDILLNASYIASLAAMSVRDILWLRMLILISSFLMIAYSVAIRQWFMVVWEVLFSLINFYQIVVLIIERRPVRLSPELDDIHRKIFSSMTAKDFISFWNEGFESIEDGALLIRDGEQPEKLMFILDGRVGVYKKERLITELGKYSFLAEMSFITGEIASATVNAHGRVKIHSWTHDTLRDMQKENPAVVGILWYILGRDLSQKLRIYHRYP